MIINISAKTGEGKTKQLIEMCANEIIRNNNTKVIFISRDKDCVEWTPYVEAICGDKYNNNFRPIYIEDIRDMIKLLPSIDRPPYNVIALDDYILSGAQLRYLHSQANNGHGKVIYTTQMDDIY